MDFHSQSLSLFESQQRYEDSQPQPQTKIVHYYEAIDPDTGALQYDGWLDNEAPLDEERELIKEAYSLGYVLKIDLTPVSVIVEKY